MKMLTLEDFNFEYPEHLVAQKPLDQRDLSRLLVRYKEDEIYHDQFKNIYKFIPEGSLVLFNDSKVIPARIQSNFLSGGSFEVFLNRCIASELESSKWEIIGRPLHKLLKIQVLHFQENLEVRLSAHPRDARLAIAEFNKSNQDLIIWLQKYARMPLPPYIRREKVEDALDVEDKNRYQCVYANEEGSVAAPTAGLHFTEAVIQSLKNKSIRFMPITLHVGAGTFLPVQSEDPSSHVMHEEIYSISRDTFDEIALAKKEARLIIAVGTTSFRAVESFFEDTDSIDFENKLNDVNQIKSSNLFVYPRFQGDLFKPRIVDALITNFHQPKSTLFMLISSLIGLEQAKKMYSVAFQNEYRLFSYGDSSLLFLK